MDDAKFKVKVERVSRAIKVSRELVSELEGASKSMVDKMRKEAVDCPVLGCKVSFIQCFLCSNFLRRVRGIVYCKGEPLGG
jgi:hypothetical protein